MASKCLFLYLLLQPLITPLGAQIANRPLTTDTGTSATSSLSSNVTTALQPSTTGTITTENHYLGPSPLHITASPSPNAPPSDPNAGDPNPATSTCSGTVDPLAIYVTSTIVIPATITLSNTLITPTPIYITPLPLCSHIAFSQSYSDGGPGGDTGPLTNMIPTGPINIASRSSTILVTKKTPVVILQTPSPTPLGDLAKTLDLNPAPAISTPGAPAPSPEQQPVSTPSSALAAIIQSIFNSLSTSPTPGPAPPSEQPPPDSAPDSASNQPASTPPQSGHSPANPPTPPPTSLIINNIPVALAPSAIIIGTQTFAPPSTPTPVTISGQTFTLLPSQVLAPGGLTLSLPPASPPPAQPLTTTIANLPITLTGNTAIINATTYALSPSHPALTTLIGTLLLTIGPSGIIFPSTTLLLPSTTTLLPAAAAPTLTALTLAAHPLAANPTLALIAGTPVPIHAGTPLTINGEIFTAGPSGLIPQRTLLPTPLISLASGEAYISGTGYAVGQGAPATTVVVGGQTVVVGPGGVAMAGTTLAAPTGTGGWGGGVLGGVGRGRELSWWVVGGVVVVGWVWGGGGL
ncbi:hypothetical protein MMC26_002615 [Xylographa opegraphella]|nr:hypothetical protein [Xylographa opegraphella]